tara:strand:- start:386 stop:793 length:408 start_codon:yes stop_codon:yes gene_type:complete
MKNKIPFIICLILFLSCNDDYIITKNKIGNYVLNEKLKDKFNKSVFDIKLNNDDLIKSIIVTNPNYKTVDGFGVGTNLNILKKSLKENEYIEKDLIISKGNHKIGNLGTTIIHNEITFVDKDNDDLVDYVWIQKL